MKKTYTIILSSLAILPVTAYSQPGIDCDTNIFWGISAGQVLEYEITGSTVTYNGIVVTAASPGNSLALCDNLNGGAFSPTFYSHYNGLAFYYDGSTWVAAPGISNCTLSNSGGAGNYLYYNVYGQGCLDKFDGSSFVQVFSSPNKIFTIADLAVDDAGNAWCLMGTSSPNTDSIYVVSPSGQVISQFAFSLNTINGFGSFLMNGILYVGLGNANPVYPNTLLPISFTATTATAGTPIPFTSSALDLAGCNAGTPLSIPLYSEPVSELIIYPAIASDYISCLINVKANTAIQFSVTNTIGEIVYSKTMKTSTMKLETKIDVSSFSKGIYFVEINNGKEKAVKKFMKK
jgi:type IX secretion system substrate protein